LPVRRLPPALTAGCPDVQTVAHTIKGGMMKFPSRLSAVLGTLILGGMAIAGEIHMSHHLHQAVLLAGGALLFLVHPEETAVVPAPPDVAPPGV
jgi:hypothetical protein